MKRHRLTFLLLFLVLAAPLLAPAIVSRGKEADGVRLTNQTSRLSTQPPDDAVIRLSDPGVLPPSAKPIQFEEFKVLNQKSVKELESRLGPEAFNAMLKINRTDRKHIRVGGTLIIPAGSADVMSLAPFPGELAIARTVPKLLLVSRRVQAFGAYESGRLARWGPTSTGKKSSPTPAGLYHTNWKARETRSSIDQSWVLPWCFNLDNFSGVSFHKFDLPGYPASHGCVRLLEEDAKWIYGWADQWSLSKDDKTILTFGTPVLIYGNYAYGEKPLWKKLADDPDATTISIDEADRALSQHMSTIASKARFGRPEKSEPATPAVTAVAVPEGAQ